jgi:hypothetical protein
MTQNAERAADKGSWSGHMARALDDVWSMLRLGIDFTPHGRKAFETEMRELVEPSLPILIHKRAKFLREAEDGTVRADLWAKELGDFMNRIFFWPNLGAHRAFVEKNRAYVAQLLDRFIAEEQRKSVAAQAVDGVPMTSRFDSSWAV